MIKSNDELIKEFIEKGGKIEILPPGENSSLSHIGKLTKQQTSLLSLEEADLFYGEISKHKKNKNIDTSSVNLELIPDHLKKILLSKLDNITREEE